MQLNFYKKVRYVVEVHCHSLISANISVLCLLSDRIEHYENAMLLGDYLQQVSLQLIIPIINKETAKVF